MNSNENKQMFDIISLCLVDKDNTEYRVGFTNVIDR